MRKFLIAETVDGLEVAFDVGSVSVITDRTAETVTVRVDGADLRLKQRSKGDMRGVILGMVNERPALKPPSELALPGRLIVERSK